MNFCLHNIQQDLYSMKIKDSFNLCIVNALDFPTEREMVNLKMGSAPRLDQLDYKIISAFPNEYLKFLFKIFNALFKKSLFSDEWKDYLLIILIPKPNGSRMRLISLLYCLIKIMINHENDLSSPKMVYLV